MVDNGFKAEIPRFSLIRIYDLETKPIKKKSEARGIIVFFQDWSGKCLAGKKEDGRGEYQVINYGSSNPTSRLLEHLSLTAIRCKCKQCGFQALLKYTFPYHRTSARFLTAWTAVCRRKLAFGRELPTPVSPLTATFMANGFSYFCNAIKTCPEKFPCSKSSQLYQPRISAYKIT
jgi:hypothetical protein